MVVAALMIAALHAQPDERSRVKCFLDKCTLPGCTRTKNFQTWSL